MKKLNASLSIKQLECNICMEKVDLKKIRTLMCDHRFCEDCL